MWLVAVSRAGWFPDNSAMTEVTPCLSRTTGVIARSANQRRLWPGCWPVIGWRWLQVESMFIINVGVTMVPATWTHTEQADTWTPDTAYQTPRQRRGWQRSLDSDRAFLFLWILFYYCTISALHYMTLMFQWYQPTTLGRLKGFHAKNAKFTTHDSELP